jgi:hypothetical protein
MQRRGHRDVTSGQESYLGGTHTSRQFGHTSVASADSLLPTTPDYAFRSVRPVCVLFLGSLANSGWRHFPGSYTRNIAFLSARGWKEGARSSRRGNSKNIAGERSRESDGKNGGFGALQGWYPRTPTESAPAPGSPNGGKSRKTRGKRATPRADLSALADNRSANVSLQTEGSLENDGSSQTSLLSDRWRSDRKLMIWARLRS